MGLSSSHLEEIIDVVLSLDCLQFSAIHRNLFKHDLKNDGKRFSSESLLQSVWSLATVLPGNRIDNIRVRGPDSVTNSELGACLAMEVTKILNYGKTPLSIPDTQALGVLSLYYISRGQKMNSLKLAKSFARAAIHLCLSETSPECPDDDYLRMRANVFCGAISLYRYVPIIKFAFNVKS